MLLIIDNYDSFTWNLVQLIGTVSPGLEVRVERNDAIDVDAIAGLNPSHIVISPGPCTPREAGVSRDVIRAFAPTIPILGVCLGHQCIGEVFGGKIVRAARPMHGKTDRIHHDGRTIYQRLPDPFIVTRYHSLIIERGSLSADDFQISAWTEAGEIMGVRHRRWPLEGVQYHPESYLTEHGETLIANFLRRDQKP